MKILKYIGPKVEEKQAKKILAMVDKLKHVEIFPAKLYGYESKTKYITRVYPETGYELRPGVGGGINYPVFVCGPEGGNNTERVKRLSGSVYANCYQKACAELNVEYGENRKIVYTRDVLRCVEPSTGFTVDLETEMFSYDEDGCAPTTEVKKNSFKKIEYFQLHKNSETGGSALVGLIVLGRMLTIRDIFIDGDANETTGTPSIKIPPEIASVAVIEIKGKYEGKAFHQYDIFQTGYRVGAVNDVIGFPIEYSEKGEKIILEMLLTQPVINPAKFTVQERIDCVQNGSFIRDEKAAVVVTEVPSPPKINPNIFSKQ